jgi:AraC family transcriptional regulator
MSTSLDLLHSPDVERISLIIARDTPRTSRGALAPWQARRVRNFVEANVSKRIAVDDVARVVNLSTSHFCRVFRGAFGVTVHDYIMSKRLEMAQRLMLSTSECLASIAISCGMSDQSHLTRWFQRVIGETPASWRRAHRVPPIEESGADTRVRARTGSHSPLSM